MPQKAGEAPRLSKEEAAAAQRVLVPPARNVVTPYWAVVDQIAEDCGPEKAEHYRAIAELLDSISLNDFQLVRRRLLHNFLPFAEATAGKKIHRKYAALSDENLDEQEVSFLDDYYTLLQAAHFKVLSRDEWGQACDNDFTFTNPLEVAWEHMDDKLLRKFWKKRLGEYANAAAITEKVLVMHRGLHLSHAKGYFYADKIDLLVLYLCADPFMRAVQPLVEAFGKIDWQTIWPAKLIVQKARSAGVGKPGSPKTVGSGPLEQRSATRDPLLDHENAHWVERVTLKDLMPDTAAVLQLLFKELTIQEPTFRDVLILFRRDLSSSMQKDEKMPIKNAKPEDMSRNIHIKRFQDIPIADMEMMFPDKKVFLKPLLLVQLLITVIIGIISVFVTILSTEASWSLIGAVLSIMGTRAYQVYSSAHIGRQTVLDMIHERLYEQTMDAQDGVMYFLLDQMADQHVKELMMAYYVLLRHGKPLTQQQLDEHCEAYIEERFGEAVDFALENSLPVLLKDGLISKDAQEYLHPVPIEEGRRILADKGKQLFSSEAKQEPHFRLPLFSRLSSPKFGGFSQGKKVGGKGSKPSEASGLEEGRGEELAAPSSVFQQNVPPLSSQNLPKPGISRPLASPGSPYNPSGEAHEPRESRSKLSTGIKNLFKPGSKKQE